MAEPTQSNQYADALQAMRPSLVATLKKHNRVMEEFTDDLYFLGLISILVQTQLLDSNDGEVVATNITNWVIEYIRVGMSPLKANVLRLFHYYLAEARARNVIFRQRRVMGIIT